MKKAILTGVVTLSFGLLGSQAALADYTCWNPAICIAVCGSETCPDDSDDSSSGPSASTSLSAGASSSDGAAVATLSVAEPQNISLARISIQDLRQELRTAPENSSVYDAIRATLADQGQARGYTCWNPAICIAVCGKKTC